MKIRFETSAVDLADAAKRFVQRSQYARDARWYAAACWSILLAAILFFVLPGGAEARGAFSAFFGFAVFFIYNYLWRPTHRGYLKYYREHVGGDRPFLCEVEITPDGITAKQLDTETRRAWSAVKEIVDTPDAVEFMWRTGGLLVVRDRAFETPEQRALFLQNARSLLTTSSTGDADPRAA